jgi:hypothetical protein
MEARKVYGKGSEIKKKVSIVAWKVGKMKGR